MPTNTPHLRTVRSFVRREGRMTPRQKQAIELHWQAYGLNPHQPLESFEPVFGAPGEVILEIGFGMGESLLAMAQGHPEQNFIGIEVHRPGVGALLDAIEAHRLRNIRVYNADAVDILTNIIPDESLHRLQIFFPDPWHKKRHQKRRLVQAPFITLVAQKLKPQGTMHIATDWGDYAEYVLAVMAQDMRFENLAGDRHFVPRPDYRPVTKFEKRGLRLGHRIWDIIYSKRL